MANKAKIGAGIALDGEKEFKQAVSEINKNMSVLGSEMQKVTAQFGDNEKSMESLSAKSEVYKKQIDSQKEKIETLQKALKNSADTYGENDKKTKDWQISLNKAEADLAKTERSLKDTESQMNDFGKESKDGGDKVEKAGKQAKNSGDDAQKGEGGWSKLGKGLSSVGALAGKAVAFLGTAAVGTATGLAAATVSASGYADEILTSSTITGISTDNLQAYKYAAELVDVSVEDMTKSMAKNIKSMSSAANGSKEMMSAYSKLGISVTNADGSLRDSQEVYWQVIDALGKVSNETERDAMAMQIFGKSAQELNPLILKGSKGMKELTDEAKSMGAVMSGESLNALGNLDDTLQKLKGGAGAAKNAIGTALLPMLSTLASDGVEMIGSFSKGIADANGDIGKIGEVVGQTLGSIVTKIAENLPSVIEAGLSIITSLGTSILNNLPTIIDAGIKALLALIDGIIQSLPLLIDGAVQVIIALADGLVQSLPTLIPTLVKTILYIVEKLIDNIDKLIDAAIQIIMALADGIIQSLPILIEKAPVIIQKLVDAIVRNFPKIIQAGLDLLKKLVSGITENLGNLGSVAADIISTLVKGIGGLWNTIKNMGGDIVKGIWEGIKGMGKWLGDQIGGFFGGILDDAKKLLGIHSPSTVFKDQIGKNMALGIGLGFSDNMDKVSDEMHSAIPTNFDSTINTKLKTVSSVDLMASAFISAIQNGGLTVQMDGKQVGYLTSKHVNNQIGFNSRAVMA